MRDREVSRPRRPWSDAMTRASAPTRVPVGDESAVNGCERSFGPPHVRSLVFDALGGNEIDGLEAAVDAIAARIDGEDPGARRGVRVRRNEKFPDQQRPSS
jgi:hypothetical protein